MVQVGFLGQKTTLTTSFDRIAGECLANAGPFWTGRFVHRESAIFRYDFFASFVFSIQPFSSAFFEWISTVLAYHEALFQTYPRAQNCTCIWKANWTNWIKEVLNVCRSWDTRMTCIIILKHVLHEKIHGELSSSGGGIIRTHGAHYLRVVFLRRTREIGEGH